MRNRVCLILVAAFWGPVAANAEGPSNAAVADPAVADAVLLTDLIERGEYAPAEGRLRSLIEDPAAPIVDGPARRLEVLRRTRIDFSLTRADLERRLRWRLPDVAGADLDRWTQSGALQHRIIDDEIRYFRKAPRNLFLLSDEARRRRETLRPRSARRRFDLDALLRELVVEAETRDTPHLAPVKHRLKYELTIDAGHPRVKPGAVVRVWLPFPQAYAQQRDVRLVSSDPPAKHVAPNGAPHRSVYFETMLTGDECPPFRMEVEFTTAAYCPDIAPHLVEPYDTSGELYRRYTAQRLPHIVLDAEVRALAAEIVGDERNPLEKARAVFRWVSDNIPWVGEMEYSIIPSLAKKGLAARCGDCGVQGTVFLSLCRAAGVPARWQSGWETQPGRWNLHDWSEIYVEPWGWLPADASYGVRDDPDPRVADFFCGRMDPYRMIVNLDYGRELDPPKTSFRSEPNDFQRGEVEIDGHNLYFNEWKYRFEFDTERLDRDARAAVGAAPAAAATNAATKNGS